MKEQFQVGEMHCAACAANVEKTAMGVAGIERAEVNLLSGSLSVWHKGEAAAAEQVIAALKQAGYPAERRAGLAKISDLQQRQKNEQKSLKIRVISSFAFLILLMVVSMGPMLGMPLPQLISMQHNPLNYALLQLILTIPILILGRSYFTNGFSALLRRAPDMDSLIALGASAAVLYGIYMIVQIAMAPQAHGMAHELYFESAAMILTLVTLGRFLESRAKGKTSEAVEGLLQLCPKNANVLRDGAPISVPVEQVEVGDLVVVRAGEAVPVDGVLTEGSGTVDQSAMTGESLPVSVSEKSEVMGGTLCRSGYFVLSAKRVGEDTTLSQMIALVEQAGASKAPIARTADKVAGTFVPVVLLLSILTAVVWLLLGKGVSYALTRAITVLVISCPCALGLATPVAISVGTGTAARHGILFHSAAALEILHRADAVVMDKTGTVTEGRPSVTDVHSFGVDKQDLFSLALSLERRSAHPLAEAVCRYAANKNALEREVTDFLAIEGQGISGKVSGVACLAGNKRMLLEHGIVLSRSAQQLGEQYATEGKTAIYFAAGRQLVGMFAIADVVRENSLFAISALQKQGLSITLLTGDNQVTAKSVGKALGISEVIAEVLPQDKAQYVKQKQQQGKTVVMIGDGVNDAPALALSDIGMAIGAGTDVAANSADVVLMRNDLKDAVDAIALSRHTMKIIRENLFWAFFYNCIGIPLAAGLFVPLGLTLSPMFASAAMSLSSVIVVTNALRLRKFTPYTEEAQK